MFKLNKTILFSFFLVAVFYCFLVSPVLAQVDTGINYTAGTGLGNEDPRIIIARLIKIFLGFLGIIAVVIIIYGGWLWMTSEGDANKIDRAKKVLISAFIGLVIILSAFGLANFVLQKLLNATGSGATGGGGGGGGSVYPPGSGGGGFVSCDGNPLTPACDADNTKCGTNEYCSASDCLCHPLGGFGDPCDSDTTTATCEADDSLCMMYLKCDKSKCICVGDPVIESISPVDEFDVPNGAVGNLITIRGRYFGITTGQVLFWDGTDNTVLAPFPNTVNPNCVDYWKDDIIIVVVPTGAIDGPIKVVRSDGKWDVTYDSNGPLINDFDVNSIVRPGVCLVNPNKGYFEDSFNVQGISFNGAIRDVKFGDQVASTSAIDISGWTNTSVDAKIPNLSPGNTTLFINVDGESSNYLPFEVLFDYNSLPIIDYIDPEKGPPGQYITIYGSNFKTYLPGTSKVIFENPSDGSTFIADGFDFPVECQDKWWYDTYIIVKVPPTITELEKYNVTVTNSLGKTSDPEIFPVISGSPGPGICLLDPHNGPVGQLVNIYGDNFGNVRGTSIVRFYNSVNAINYPDWTNQMIQTNVPSGAETGPIVAVVDGTLSNRVPFTVGSCSTNSECSTGEECCGSGTYWAGICRPAGTCGEGSPLISGYGWTFSVGNGASVGAPCDSDLSNAVCDPDDTLCSGTLVCNPISCTCQPPDIKSCSGYNMLQCADSLFCPNSPGVCSSYPGGGTIVVGSCKYNCEGIGLCNSAICSYNNVLDRCVLNGSSCGLTKTVTDIFGNSVTAYCENYGGSGRWIFTSSASCPSGWTKISGNRCMENSTTCSLCGSGFVCQDDGDGDSDGVCVVDIDICSGDAICQPSNQCISNDSEICECCCRIGKDAQDCCAPLRCEGDCGSDRVSDTDTYGYCSGCRIDSNGDGFISSSEQALSDQACNCDGHSGKFCDVDVDVDGDGKADGICRDCGQLDSTQCNLHNTSCCIDYMDGNVCRGGDGTLISGGYCAYYSCQTTSPFVCSGPDKQGDYEDSNCNNECGVGGGLGISCSLSASTTCNISICSSPFSCLTESGSPISFPSDCGVCCCDPNVSNSCSTLNPSNPNLVCQPDQAPCTGNNRGLCCGCENDSDCGLSDIVGCDIDTCCRARPSIIDISPADNSMNICRNTAIKITFNQTMDISSFSGNIILFGDYGSDVCPPETQFLASYSERKWWNKTTKKIAYIIEKIISPFWSQKSAKAYTPPSSTHNYCAVPGSITAYNNAAGHGIVEFKPNILLDGDRLYYVVIKGDGDLNDNTKEGVLSFYGVSFNGGSTETFNHLTYTNSYISSFITLPEQPPNNGVCEISYIDIEPESYLFNTIENSLLEDDTNPNSNTFDTVNDIDKVFVAFPKSVDGQVLSPVPGYSWTWTWSSLNPSAADIVSSIFNNPNMNKRLIRANNNITDGKTIITATANLSVGGNISGQANVYVFICENPWPPVDASGIWRPWSDAIEGSSCLAGTGPCLPVNYEIYYCRDSGAVGTADDLPAILSDDTVIRGSSANSLKEFYFFREEVPDPSNSLTAVDNLTGGSVTLTWSPVSGASGYKLYWGTNSGSYSNYLDVGNVTSYTINDLENDRTYYFVFTSYTKQGAESEYSNEVAITPTDQTPPSPPSGLTFFTSSKQVELRWNPVADAVSYKVYYGVNSGQYGYSEDVGNVTDVIITDLNNNQTYYFVVTALDDYNNESGYSSEVSATPTD